MPDLVVVGLMMYAHVLLFRLLMFHPVLILRGERGCICCGMFDELLPLLSGGGFEKEVEPLLVAWMGFPLKLLVAF